MSFNPPIASNSNRFNSQGQAPKSFAAKTSLVLSNTIPAGKSIQLPVAGNFFYVQLATGEIKVRPSGAGYVGIYNPYTVGTGLRVPVENSFSMLEIKNESTINAVAFSIFIGFDEYLDKRLVLANTESPDVLYPTYSVPGSAEVIDIPDLAGLEFLDVNGGKWIAVKRVAILVFNEDDTVTYRVQSADSAGIPATGTPIANPAVGSCYPLTTLRLDVSGDYRIGYEGAGMVNGIVSEIYQAISNPN